MPSLYTLCENVAELDVLLAMAQVRTYLLFMLKYSILII